MGTYMMRPELEEFLYLEARLLDSMMLDEWLGLFEADATYRVPIAAPFDESALQVSLINDDLPHLTERVRRITGGRSFSQAPASQTVRIVSNVEGSENSDGIVIVRSKQLIVELRRGVQTMFAADCTHQLRRRESEPRIVAKEVVLLNRAEPLGDLTFLL